MSQYDTIYGFPRHIHEASERIIRNDIYLNQTCLVDNALHCEFFHIDDLDNGFDKNNMPIEIYEWWLISEFLADQLRDIGEPILSNEHGVWWGRSCTGQAIILDGTIQRIVTKIDRAII